MSCGGAWRAAAAACTLACAPAHALDIAGPGELSATLQGTLTLGTQLRMQGPSPQAYSAVPAAAIAAPPGLLQGQSGGSDLNFGRGDPVSTMLKGVLDLDVRRGGLGLFVRSVAWKDFALGQRDAAYGNFPNGFMPGVPLSDAGFARSARFQGVELREAYLRGEARWPSDVSADLRLGRQVLPWGTAQLTPGGIAAAINPSDRAAQARPGALASEAWVPQGMLSASLKSPAGWSVEAFAGYEFRPTVLPGCGTYFDVVSYAPEGCNFAALANAGPERVALATGNYLHRRGDARPGGGQFGLALGWRAPAIATDFKAYALNTHASVPSLRVAVNSPVPGVRAADYGAVYPDNVTLLGASFATRLAEDRSTVYGEFAHRRDQPLSLSAFDVVSAFVTRSPASLLAINKGVLAIAPGGSFDAFDRHGVSTLLLGASRNLPGLLGASRAALQGEIGYSRVHGLPDPGQLRYGRPLAYNGAGYPGGPPCVDAVPGKTCTDQGYVSRSAWGVRLLASATYPMPGWRAALTPSLFVAQDVKGWSYDGTYSQGRRVLRPGVRIDWAGGYYLDFTYARYSGGAYNLLIDRDYLALAAGLRF